MKAIIELAYTIQQESGQSKIIPLVSVDTVPIINSILFMDYGGHPDERIIKLTLPMMAMYDIPSYVPYLYHEIFHYVAPGNRLVRNWAKGVLLTVLAMRNLAGEVLKVMAEEEDEKVVAAVLDQILMPYVLDVLVFCVRTGAGELSLYDSGLLAFFEFIEGERNAVDRLGREMRFCDMQMRKREKILRAEVQSVWAEM